MVEEKASANNKFFTVDRARAAFSQGDGVTITGGDNKCRARCRY